MSREAGDPQAEKLGYLGARGADADALEIYKLSASRTG
jgi:hypothetical protein